MYSVIGHDVIKSEAVCFVCTPSLSSARHVVAWSTEFVFPFSFSACLASCRGQFSASLIRSCPEVGQSDEPVESGGMSHQGFCGKAFS